MMTSGNTHAQAIALSIQEQQHRHRPSSVQDQQGPTTSWHTTKLGGVVPNSF
jgi:hypothetical protein